jgi:hypothetical protein
MEKETERITKSLAIVERQINELKDSGNKTALEILRKKEARLKEELKGTQMSTNALAKNLLAQRKNIKSLSKIEFNDLIRRLSKRPEYAFLKTMPKEKIKTDLQRTAKPVGWRFKGRGNYDKPTAKQIVAGKKSGRVYNERRPLRSDVSQVVKLKKGGEVDEENYRYKDIYQAQGGIKFKTEAEAKSWIKSTKPFIRKQLREGNFVLVFNGKEFFIGEKIKINDDDEFANGGNVDSDEILTTAKFNVSRIKEGKTSATKFTYYERLDEVNKLIDSLEKGTIKPARIIGTGYRGNTKKIANNWLIKEKAIAEKTIELLEEPTANKKTISLYSQIKRSEKIAKELFEEDGILMKYVKNNKFDSDLFEKYLKDKFNSKGSGENILKYWSKQLDMIPSDYYNGDEENGYILENVEFEQDAKKRASQLFDIYKSLPTTTKTKTSSLAFNIKKHSKEIIDLMIEEITRLTNTRPLAVKKFFEQHNLTEKEISNISLGLGMGKIKPSDFSGAIVGDKVSEKAIIKFAKSNQAYKVEPMSKEDTLNRDIKLYLELNIKKEGYNSPNVRMAQLVIDSLGDANFHEEAYQFAKLIDPKLTTKEKYYKSELMNPTPSDSEVARKVSEMAKYDGHAISEAYEYFLKSKDFIKEAIYLNQVFNPKSSKKAPSNKVNSIKDASYISNRDIVSLTIKKGSDTVTINGDDILDGVYLKNTTKMEQGGNIGRTISFMDWRGDVRTGVITERLKRGYEVMTSDGVALVEDSEIIE